MLILNHNPQTGNVHLVPCTPRVELIPLCRGLDRLETANRFKIELDTARIGLMNPVMRPVLQPIVRLGLPAEILANGRLQTPDGHVAHRNCRPK